MKNYTNARPPFKKGAGKNIPNPPKKKEKKMNTPTKPKDIERINKMFWSLEELVGNLYGRWLDEGKYEDINTYKPLIEKQLKKHKFTLVGMTKKPFGFTFKINNTNAVYTIAQTTKQYRWLRYL